MRASTELLPIRERARPWLTLGREDASAIGSVVALAAVGLLVGGRFGLFAGVLIALLPWAAPLRRADGAPTVVSPRTQPELCELARSAADAAGFSERLLVALSRTGGVQLRILRVEGVRTHVVVINTLLARRAAADDLREAVTSILIPGNAPIPLDEDTLRIALAARGRPVTLASGPPTDTEGEPRRHRPASTRLMLAAVIALFATAALVCGTSGGALGTLAAISAVGAVAVLLTRFGRMAVARRAAPIDGSVEFFVSGERRALWDGRATVAAIDLGGRRHWQQVMWDPALSQWPGRVEARIQSRLGHLITLKGGALKGGAPSDGVTLVPVGLPRGIPPADAVPLASACPALSDAVVDPLPAPGLGRLLDAVGRLAGALIGGFVAAAPAGAPAMWVAPLWLGALALAVWACAARPQA